MLYQTTTITTFLLEIRPVGLINIGAIQPSGGPPIMKTFRMPDELESAMTFTIELNKRGFNCYFEPNPPNGVLNKKAKVEDIAQVDFLVVDIDPDCSVSFEKGMTEIWGNTIHELHMSYPFPTIILGSGNGIQAFYRLDEPSTDFELCTQMNKALAEKFGGDNTYSIDHLFRIPGTLNYPTKVKLDKGYPAEPSMSRIIFMEDE